MLGGSFSQSISPGLSCQPAPFPGSPASPAACATLQAPPPARPRPGWLHLAGSREYARVRCSHGGGGGGCGCGRRGGGGRTAGVRRGAGSCGPGGARRGPEDAVSGSAWTASGLGLLPAGSRLGLRVGAWPERRRDQTVLLCFPECGGRVPIRIPFCLRSVSGPSQQLEHGRLVHGT